MEVISYDIFGSLLWRMSNETDVTINQLLGAYSIDFWVLDENFENGMINYCYNGRIHQDHYYDEHKLRPMISVNPSLISL